MGFTEVLKRETIVTHVKAHEKAEVLDAMAELFLKAGIITDKEAYLKDVYERETVGETGIGNYVAIPHGRSEAVVTPGVAIAVLDQEIAWESLDGTGAKVVILFAVGTGSAGADEHLRLLAMFSKKLGDDAVIERLLLADTPDDVLAAFLEEAEEAEAEEKEEAELDLDELVITL